MTPTQRTSVQRATGGTRHTQRPRPAHAGLISPAPSSHARAILLLTDQTSSATQAAVLQERARIARELHDGVSQTLYAVTLGASRVLTLLQQSEHGKVERLIDDVLQLASTAESELRALFTDLRSDQPASGGLTAALADLASEVRKRNALACLEIRVSVSHEPDVPTPVKHTVLMIAREALHNIVRHSNARHVDVALESDAEQLVLQITDDGRGFNPATPRPGHFGLQSMCERAVAIGGTFALTSAVGAGTQLRVTLPVRVDTDG